jgi:hypothetical protein
MAKLIMQVSQNSINGLEFWDILQQRHEQRLTQAILK